MRFVGYVRSGGRDPQDRMMGIAIDDRVAPLATVDAFYEDLSGWRQRASGLTVGEIPLADLTLAPPVPRDAKIVCAAINYVKHGVTFEAAREVFKDPFALDWLEDDRELTIEFVNLVHTPRVHR